MSLIPGKTADEPKAWHTRPLTEQRCLQTTAARSKVGSMQLFKVLILA
jgi:hypothetical protein